ncbi:MAG: hypothetical protein DRG69_02635 [Deltaproteobacteria bacterium]|nr:MAG: hypothetical protein DRG69_02635 [Deltaproteobacteria bacterium]
MFKPLEKKRYSEQIAEMIQEKILKQRLQQGTRLPTERELAEEFQVSRTVIREAIRELEVAGLVRIKKGPKGGIFIDNAYHKPLSASLRKLITSGWINVDHILEVRMLIEPYIASQASLKAKKSDIEAMRSLLQNSSAHLDDVALLKKNNIEFHLLIAKASGNPVFSILMRSVMDILEEIARDFLVLSIERDFFQAHKEIFDLIVQRDPEKVRKAIEEDILDVNRRLSAFLRRAKASR